MAAAPPLVKRRCQPVSAGHGSGCAAVQARSTGARPVGKGYGLICRLSEADRKRENAHIVDELVKANQADLAVRTMCKTLHVSPSGYSDWLAQPACAQAHANAVLLQQSRQAHAASDATYGEPKIQADLADQGLKAGHHHIAAGVRANGLRSVSRRRGVVDEKAAQEPPHSAEPCAARVHRHRHQPNVDGRPDLHPDLGRVRLSGGGARCPPRQGDEVGVWPTATGRPCNCSAEHGAHRPQAVGRHPSR